MITEENEVKLIDFGVAKIASKTLTFTGYSLGTTCYMAPENFEVDGEIEPTDKPIAITTKADIWSFGTVISELFSQVKPWSNKCNSSISIERKLVNKDRFPVPKNITDNNIVNLIKKCCQIEPNLRYSAGDLIEKIQELIDANELQV